MGSWVQREKLDNIYNANVNNNVRKFLGSNIGAVTNARPEGIVTTDTHMNTWVETLFQNQALRIASSRHGAIYDVPAVLLQNLGNILQQAPSAYVSGDPYTSKRALVKVNRITPSKEWSDWLRFRIREARMHKKIAELLDPVSRCFFVAPFLFAGLDMSTGMYFTAMMRPPGSILPIATMVKTKELNMRVYRAVEAAIANVWRMGAMVTDTSQGNILYSTAGFATIVDFDSSIVLPEPIRSRMLQQIDALWKSRKVDKCYRIMHSKTADLVTAFDFVTREQVGVQKLKRLAIEVYGRRSWFPDSSMLGVLFQTAQATPDRTKTPRRRIFHSLRKAFRKNAESTVSKQSTVNLPEVRMRRIGALPEREKSEWRIRHHGGHHRRERSRPHSSVFSPVRSIVNNNDNDDVRTLTTSLTSGSIPMPASRTTRTNNQNAKPFLNNNVRRLVTPNARNPFGRAVNNIPSNNANAKNSPKNTTVSQGPATNQEFRDFRTLNSARKKVILDREVQSLKATDVFDEFKKKLLQTSSGGTLDKAIQKKFPNMAWSALNKNEKSSMRQELVDDIATDAMSKIMYDVLEMGVGASQTSKVSQIRRKMSQALASGSWTDWLYSWARK